MFMPPQAVQPARRAASVAQLIPRQRMAQGAYSPLFDGYRRNAITPGLYEAIRGVVPMVDSAIHLYNLLDGVPVIVGNNGAIVQELNRFSREVQVGDNMHGLPAYCTAKRDEVHEQGFGISEHLLDDSGIFRLNVADSKSIHFARKKNGVLGWYFDPYQLSRLPLTGTASATVSQILQHRTPINIGAINFGGQGFVELNRTRTHYLAFQIENADAYGVSLLRSIPVFVEAFLTIINAIQNTWERFGDPSFHLEYKSGIRLGDQRDSNDDTPLEARRKMFERWLSSALQGKKDGASADFVTALDKDSSVSLSVIGADNQVLDASIPITKIVEQIQSGLKLPSWLLGIDSGSVQGQAKQQAEVMQQASAMRNNMERIHIERICALHLRARGFSWSDDMVAIKDQSAPQGIRMVRGDWHIEYHRPNLSDIVAHAQANFMNTQSDILRDRTGGVDTNSNPANAPISITTDNVTTTHNTFIPDNNSQQKVCNHASPHDEPISNIEKRPIENPELDTVEQDALAAIQQAYGEMIDFVLRVLGLGETTVTFSFDNKDKKNLDAAFDGFVVAISDGNGSALVKAYVRAWSQGIMDAFAQTGQSTPTGSLNNDAAVEQLLVTSKQEFNDYYRETMTPQIHALLEAGTSAGENPLNIARNLTTELGGRRWKWEQIARSEIALAWGDAKKNEWQAEKDAGLIDDLFNFLPAPDGCPECKLQALGNPYTLMQLPRPVRDTHPSCRCDQAPASPFT